MSLFPRSFITEPSFTPLFRLLDEFDNYRSGSFANATGTSLKTFSPKFDVKENQNSYELHGELPGIEQKDVEIEFTDAHTLTIRGRTERTYESGTRPAGFVKGPVASGAITEGGETDGGHKVPHKATVEDEGAASTTEVAKKEEPKEESKYWASERSVGEFSRSFSFPVRVDQDHVKASMKNGILSILVPKMKKHESRKITIS
ncbi:hypothetical protein G7Y89_g7481 [Cudoniella acicularis]|uniref:SHSP domain-containing protein n=1 Tax=Cudoniella acicularis TaxID=354080 RepID=A0A8H4W1X5_9HELO|nr:hypothetical protein G7Y89_g7481 [Cudoniella acicularis]